MKLVPEQPVGIFDSGVGGLTVANAVRNILPGEKIIYFGDTAHLPYGDKSESSIIGYSLSIADYLLKKNCKLILIACNTASAMAYEIVKEHCKDKVPVIDVITPVVDYVCTHDNIKKIGVIGTKNTINSNCYLRKINDKTSTKQVIQHATPLLASMIEEGFIYDDISNAIIRSYLSSDKLSDIDSLILACTHYPIIKNQIRKFYGFQKNIIDSSVIVAKELKRVLSEMNLLNNELEPKHEFYLSDYTDFFRIIAEMFFEETINLSKENIKL